MDRLHADGGPDQFSMRSTRCRARIGFSTLIIALFVAAVASMSQNQPGVSNSAAEPVDASIDPGLVESHLQLPAFLPKSYRVRTGGYELTAGR